MTTLAPKRELQRRIGNHNGDRRNPTPNSSMISRARAHKGWARMPDYLHCHPIA
jgi:hypothetical protein